MDPITSRPKRKGISWGGGHVGWNVVPFALVHLVALAGALLIEFEWEYLLWCAGSYYLRMFGLTAGYHRYFAHRSYRAGRGFQFALAVLAVTSFQKGVLWWAAHHRAHHQYSDTERDLHSPVRRGFWWSHMGWILVENYSQTDVARIRDFARFPELRWLDRWWITAVVAYAAAFLALGGPGALIWGFFVSTVLLWHGTFFINSLAHVFGRVRYQTGDTSKNSLLLALLTMGEGWHNNHHYYQGSVRQGFFWWEIDVTWYFLVALSRVGLVGGLRGPPEKVRLGLWKAPLAASNLPSVEDLRERVAGLIAAVDGAKVALAVQIADVESRVDRLPEEVRARLDLAAASLRRLPDDALARLNDAGVWLAALPEGALEEMARAEESARARLAESRESLRVSLLGLESALDGLPEELRKMLAEPSWGALPREIVGEMPSLSAMLGALEPRPAQ